MVEKWDASFNRIGHFHSVTEKNKQIVGKTGLRPKIERLVKRMAAGQLTGDIDVLEETRRLVEGAGAFCEFVREHRLHFQGKRGRGFHPSRDEAEEFANVLQRPASAFKRRVGVAIRRSHIPAEVEIAPENFIGAFAGEDNLKARIADGAAEKILGDPVRIHAESFGVGNGIGEVLAEFILPHGNGGKFRAGHCRHFPGNFLFIVLGTVESESKRSDRALVVARRKTKDGTGINSTARVRSELLLSLSTAPSTT